jgi:SET domain-containing protein
MNKVQILNQMRGNVYCRLAPSKIHGVGVFAVRGIPKNCNPFIGCFSANYVGITERELCGMDKGVQKIVRDFQVAEKGKWYLPSCGIQKLDVSFYLNHSEKANVVSDYEGNFTTTRKIKKGEEVTSNYNQYDTDTTVERKDEDFR